MNFISSINNNKQDYYKCLFLPQDYNWWWRSFLTSGFTAFYLAVYCVHYFITKLEIEGMASTFLYLGYTSIMVFMFFMMTGKRTHKFQIAPTRTGLDRLRFGRSHCSPRIAAYLE